ncbi:cell-envelope stress modulator CpxP [Photorhabdus antumapuensis]|uniref:cell-envelope stress modulator CpxP n=1 Tax=Photorhabdus antumapuensis TaxID=2862867 RepID=UPI001CECD148|nr:cell-envelope stress modulator CpxP [Photorhabdus antumapuensis]MCA6222258.1 Spy/CpxP family protein refolding chaperone [Photorhabdus antumapuensis]
MRNIAALALASMFVLSSTASLAGTASTIHAATVPDNCAPCDYKNVGSYHYRNNNDIGDNNHMFNGITLTEQQRQQMRDLVGQNHQQHSSILMSRAEREEMRKLVTAKDFDEVAVKALVEKMVRCNVERQLEMVRIHHQMYQLLTPEQQAQLEQHYRQRMSQLPN